MVESKDNRSQFIPYETNAVRFSVDAFMFKRMSGQVSKDLCYELSGFCLNTMLID